MATALNPHAPLFVPATGSADDELSHIYPPCRPPPLQSFPSFIPPQYDHGCFRKTAIFFNPSLIYYHSPSFSLFPNFSYYVSLPKCITPTITEPDAVEVSGVLSPLGGKLGGVEQGFPIEAKAMEEQSMRTVSSSHFAIRGLRGRFGCRHLNKHSSQQWVRKSSSADESPQEASFSSSDHFQFFRGAKSTVMIKNIPNKFSRKPLLDWLDEHCRVQNQKIQEEGSDEAFSEFDFLYLPMDFISGNNLGYAFVNFTSPAAARRLHQSKHMIPWNTFGSRKICEISHAKIQGLKELVKHFNRSLFACSSTEFLPVYFEPSRDGYNDPAEQLVGKLVQR